MLAGKYTLQNVVGTANFATVYDATVLHEGASTCGIEKVAIKIVEASDKKALDALRKEWQVYQGLRIALCGNALFPRFDCSSATIIDTYDFFECSGRAHIVMELAQHGDLVCFLSRNQLDEAQIASIFYQVAEAIEQTHSAGFVHRDIKPHNILVVKPAPEVKVKLADFGLAKEMGKSLLWARECSAADYQYVSPETTDMMNDGMAMRVFEYQANDIFALGLVLFFMIVGKAPTKADRQAIQFDQIQLHPHLAPLKRVSPSCIQLLKKLMHDDNEVRGTAAEAMEHEWVAHHIIVDSEGNANGLRQGMGEAVSSITEPSDLHELQFEDGRVKVRSPQNNADSVEQKKTTD